MHDVMPWNTIRQTFALLLATCMIGTAIPAAYAVTEDAAAANEKTAPVTPGEDAPAATAVKAEPSPPPAATPVPTQTAAPAPVATAAPPSARFSTETIAATATSPGTCVWRTPSIRDQTAEIQMAVVLGGGPAPELLVLLEGAMSLDGVVMMMAFSEAQLVNNRIFDSTGAPTKQEKGSPFHIVLPANNLDSLVAALGTPGATLHYAANGAARSVIALPAADATDVAAFKTCVAQIAVATPVQ